MNYEKTLELEAEHYCARTSATQLEAIKKAYMDGAKRKDFKPSKVGTISMAILAVFFLFFSVFGTLFVTPMDASLKVILMMFFIAGISFSIMCVHEWRKYNRDKWLY